MLKVLFQTFMSLPGLSIQKKGWNLSMEESLVSMSLAPISEMRFDWPHAIFIGQTKKCPQKCIRGTHLIVLRRR